METLTSESAQLTEEAIREMADFFRLIFANSYAEQYLFYPSIGKAISPQQADEMYRQATGERLWKISPDGDMIPLDQLDALNLETFPRYTEPAGEQALFWMDPKTTLANFERKLRAGAHIVTLREQDTRALVGLIFGHQCTVLEAFETEEWINPHCYSVLQDSRHHRVFSTSLDRLNEVLREHPVKFQGLLEPRGQLYSDSLVYVWNCYAIVSSLRKQGRVAEMTRKFFALLPREMKENLIELGEPLYGSKSHLRMKVAGAVDVPGILTPERTLTGGEAVLIAAPLHEFAEVYSLSDKDFRKRMRSLARSCPATGLL